MTDLEEFAEALSVVRWSQHLSPRMLRNFMVAAHRDNFVNVAQAFLQEINEFILGQRLRLTPDLVDLVTSFALNDVPVIQKWRLNQYQYLEKLMFEARGVKNEALEDDYTDQLERLWWQLTPPQWDTLNSRGA